jgi:hypothetical protein
MKHNVYYHVTSPRSDKTVSVDHVIMTKHFEDKHIYWLASYVNALAIAEVVCN